MFQHLFHRRAKTPPPRFAQSLLLVLIAVFTLLLHARPVLALSGLGTTLIVAAALVELNRERIWQNYKKSYKKGKGWRGRFTQPEMTYYTINTVLLWPFIAVLGLACLYATYVYTT